MNIYKELQILIGRNACMTQVRQIDIINWEPLGTPKNATVKLSIVET